QLISAIALFGLGTDLEVIRQEPPRLTVPVRPRSAEVVPEKERAHLAHRQCLLVALIPECECLLRNVLHQFISDCVFIFIVYILIILSATLAPAFKPHHLEAGFRRFGGNDPAGPADTDGYNIYFIQL